MIVELDDWYLSPTAFEMDFASEIPLSAIKSMICRRFSLFRFRLSDLKSFYQTPLRSSKLSVRIPDASDYRQFYPPFSSPFPI